MYCISSRPHFVKFIAKITAIIASGLLFLSACENEGNVDWERQSDVLYRGLYANELILDPQRVNVISDSALVRDLFVGLMAFDAKGNIVPAIAKHSLTEDGKRWLFLLDEAAVWSNGEKVTANDFVASWQRLIDAENASQWGHYLAEMKIENARAILEKALPISDLGVQALEPHTLQIELEEPNFQLPLMLTHIALLPSYQGKLPTENWVFNGAFRLVKLAKDYALLERQEGENLLNGFSTVIYQLIHSGQSLKMFDMVENPLSEQGTQQIVLPRLCTYFYEFNFNEPTVGQKSVRKAIKSMISATEMSKELGLATHSALPKTMWQGEDRLPFISHAESILAQSGIDHSNVVKITLSFGTHHLHSIVASRFARLLAQSDLFRVRLQEVENRIAIQKREQQDFQLMPREICAAYFDSTVFLNMFHSQSPENRSGYGNKQVDNWLEELNYAALTAEQRNQRVVQIVRQLNEDVAILPLFQYQRRIAVDPTIGGIYRSNASDVIYSKDLFRQTIKDK